MNHIQSAFAIAAIAATTSALFVAGCANPSRSRDLANPQVKAIVIAQQVCSSCHGMTGVSGSPNFPTLAAQMPEYLAAQLREFRGHDRSDPAGFEYMWGLSRNLTDEQIKGLAAYYAQQAPAHPGPQGSDERMATGDSIFHAGLPDKSVPACASCHGDRGQGVGAFPRIAGQHADYVVKQLVVFQRTDQRPAGAAMKIVAHGLSASDIENVAAYIQALQ